MSKESLISVVDDDQAIRTSIRRLMRSFGFAVETFPSAIAFLESPNREKTGCLITDINMPEMTGVELYGRLIETGQAIPTILITAYPDETVRARVLSDGAVCYLTKPFDDEALLLCVREALERDLRTGKEKHVLF